jgi:hypothetical protein
VAEVTPSQVLHHDVRPAIVGAAEVEDRDRIGVAQAARGSRLVEEAGRRELLVAQARVHDLHGDGAPQRDLLGAIHAAHSADADEVRHAIAAGQRSSYERVFLRRRRRQLRAACKTEAMSLVTRDGASLARDHQ